MKIQVKYFLLFLHLIGDKLTFKENPGPGKYEYKGLDRMG